MNNKQIMYDCDKGYILSEKGPVGATCVGGLWRPTELPSCLPGLHPRLRWTRRKRHTQTGSNRTIFRSYNRFKRGMSEILRKNLVVSDPFPLQMTRNKRSLLHHYRRVQRKIHRRPIRNQNVERKWHLVAPATMRFKRSAYQKRFPQIEYQFTRTLRNNFLNQQQQQHRLKEFQQRAYNRYYEKIRQKHRNYINNLLRASHRQSVMDDEPLIFDTKDTAHLNEDNYKVPAKDPFDEINAYASMPIPLPNINENRNVYTKKELIEDIINNTFVGRRQTNQEPNENLHKINNNNLPETLTNDYYEFMPKQSNRNITNKLDLLKSQIIRRKKRIYENKHLEYEHIRNTFRRMKRTPRSPKKTDDQPDEDVGSDIDNSKKSRPKEPCEVIDRFYYI